MPDIIGFADYAFSARDFIAELHHAGPTAPPRSLVLFPYPNTASKFRWMAVAEANDLVLLRSAAGRIVAVTDALLSPRVYSARLVRQPPAWRLRVPRKAHDRFRQAAAGLLRNPDVLPMCRTDVRSYYASVEPDRLESHLTELGCPHEPVSFVLDRVRAWICKSGLQGLPVGPESSAVLGNAFLTRVDDTLAAEGILHLRYMDDLLLFGAKMRDEDRLLEILDHALMKLQLLRSIDKTHTFETQAEAVADIQDSLLASLGAVAHSHPAMPLQEVETAFEEWIIDCPEPKRSHFHYTVRFMLNRGDAYGARKLAACPELMNVDPALSAEYLCATALDDLRVVDDIFSLLEQPARDNTDGLQLHLFKGCASRGWGMSEGHVFLQTALDPTRRAPVREWAWQALRRTPTWQPELVVDGMDQEEEPRVRRAMVVSLGRFEGDRIPSAALHLQHAHPELRHTVQWLLAA